MSQEDHIRTILGAQKQINEIAQRVRSTHGTIIAGLAGADDLKKDPCASSWSVFRTSNTPVPQNTPRSQPEYVIAAYQDTAQKLYTKLQDSKKISVVQLAAIKAKLDAAEKLRETTMKPGKFITTTKNVYAAYGDFLRDIAGILYNNERTDTLYKLKKDIDDKTKNWGNLTSTIAKNVSFTSEFNSIDDMISAALGVAEAPQPTTTAQQQRSWNEWFGFGVDNANVLGNKVAEMIRLYNIKINDPDFNNFIREIKVKANIKVSKNLDDQNKRYGLIELVNYIVNKLFPGQSPNLTILSVKNTSTFVKNAIGITNSLIAELNKRADKIQNPVAEPGGGSSNPLTEEDANNAAVINVSANAQPGLNIIQEAINKIKGATDKTSLHTVMDNIIISTKENKEVKDAFEKKRGNFTATMSTSSGSPPPPPMQPSEAAASEADLNVINDEFLKIQEKSNLINHMSDYSDIGKVITDLEALLKKIDSISDSISDSDKKKTIKDEINKKLKELQVYELDGGARRRKTRRRASKHRRATRRR
jgi:hypothetical protein